MERPAFLAGRWYPDDPATCAAVIDRHARDTTPETGPWRGMIGPHAGWFFSGDLAAQAWRWLAENNPDADLVVLFGSHRGPTGPNTVFREAAWQTPLGPMHTAQPLADAVATALGLDDEPARPMRPDNAVEVHLPMAKRYFPDAELLMVGVEAGPRAPEIGQAVAAAVKQAGRTAVYVGSTDLTHYGPNYGWAPHGGGAEAVAWVRDVNDQGFLDRVLDDDVDGLLAHAAEHQSACCPGAVAATHEAVRAEVGRVHPRLLGHTLSADKQPGDSFVGYAGVLL